MIDLNPGPYKEGELPITTAERIVAEQFEAPAKLVKAREEVRDALACVKDLQDELKLVYKGIAIHRDLEAKALERVAELECANRLAYKIIAGLEEEIEQYHRDQAGESI